MIWGLDAKRFRTSSRAFSILLTSQLSTHTFPFHQSLFFISSDYHQDSTFKLSRPVKSLQKHFIPNVRFSLSRRSPERPDTITILDCSMPIFWSGVYTTYNAVVAIWHETNRWWPTGRSKRYSKTWPLLTWPPVYLVTLRSQLMLLHSIIQNNIWSPFQHRYQSFLATQEEKLSRNLPMSMLSYGRDSILWCTIEL